MLTFPHSHLFEGTSNELTVYLGPWDVVESDQCRVAWQCNYQGETLEQYRAYKTWLFHKVRDSAD